MTTISQIGHNSSRLHPVDELVEVRSQIRALKAREDELRQKIIETGDRVGDRFKASVITNEREQLDHAALKREFGMAMLRPFVKTQTTTFVRTKEI